MSEFFLCVVESREMEFRTGIHSPFPRWGFIDMGEIAKSL